MIYAVIKAALLVTAIGLICAAVLVIAAVFMSVRENEKEKKLRECLPGANCGACGYTGCDGYAKALCDGSCTKTNLCVPGGSTAAKEIADVLGVGFEDTVPLVAAVLCNGDCNSTEKKALYSGIETCAAAKLIYGGDGSCSFGCIGRGDCAAVCPNGAVCLDGGVARILPDLCIGCGLCAKSCPQGIIRLIPANSSALISCSNKQKGAEAMKVCKSACIGCGLCARACPNEAITVSNNLASIDHSKCTGCMSCVSACKKGCIHAI